MARRDRTPDEHPDQGGRHAPKRKRRWLKRLFLVGLAGFVALLALVGIGYAMTDIPDPNDSSVATATRILYSDRSELGRVGAENRIPISIDPVPAHVKQAVLAAEDRGFYTEPGISPRGIGRALFTNIRGGGEISQGGSTITQQYAKNAFLSSERTYTRKIKEIFIAVKMSRTLPKDQVLEDYLNTIYFGRQASGIEVASKTYFGRSAKDLSVAQGAVLAASIRSPASLDPEKHPEVAKRRWEYVLDGMVEKGWLTQADRDKQVYPPVLGIGEGPKNNDLSGPKGHVIAKVLDELSQQGFDEAKLNAGGLVVQTSIRKGAQEAAVKAVQERTGEEPGKDDLQGALVSIDPGTGEIWAYYGGATGTGFDFASNGGVGRQPGSSFKPYVLATALSEGLSLRTRLDGNSPKDFPGVKDPGISNFGDRDFGRVDLLSATRNSINTAYFELGLEVGPKKVADLAHAAGIPDSTKLAGAEGETNGSIALGSYDVQVIDQARGFATFANKGVPVQPFLVKQVFDRKGEALYSGEIRTGEPAFSEDVAADATSAMQQVVDRGTARAAQLEGGREAAGKTGTTTDNYDAWFVGFTPQLSTAVWFGYAQVKTIENNGREGTGGGVAAPVWKSYMDAALEGKDNIDFPPAANVGRSRSVDSGNSGTTRKPSFKPRPRRTGTRSSARPESSTEPSSAAVPSRRPSVAPAPSPAAPKPKPSKAPTSPRPRASSSPAA